MPSSRQGSIHLFRVAGIDVFLHWWWFLMAAFEISTRGRSYSTITWNILEYLALFLIVLLHEFGHALACRQVGGTANRIMLWPLGGVAYVDPPPRPGATLWSIAAGPLVNVVLLPILWSLVALGRTSGWAEIAPDAYRLLRAVLYIDIGLLVFNILPVYPLDGGQILRALLWFVLGRARSLLVATVLGLIGAAGFAVLAVWKQSVWLGIISFYMVTNSWGGFQHARALSRVSKLPRRHGFACPTCKTAPPVGDFWKCGRCGQGFDTFATNAVCPYCGARFDVTKCLDCGAVHPMSEWAMSVLVPPNL
ncbi:MAG TPA: site-2 protease family protein [Candidatus Sulfotelmatobacter sp.]|nr:site-2 protease family protein [Candidatus Sulfotelmatobacter sp.]